MQEGGVVGQYWRWCGAERCAGVAGSPRGSRSAHSRNSRVSRRALRSRGACPPSASARDNHVSCFHHRNIPSALYPSFMNDQCDYWTTLNREKTFRSRNHQDSFRRVWFFSWPLTLHRADPAVRECVINPLIIQGSQLRRVNIGRTLTRMLIMGPADALAQTLTYPEDSKMRRLTLLFLLTGMMHVLINIMLRS